MSKIEQALQKMELEYSWSTLRKIHDDATITQAETTAVVEAARSICCLVQTGQINKGGKLIEEWNQIMGRKRSGWKRTLKEDKSKRDDRTFIHLPIDISSSNSASFTMVISTSILAKEMTSSSYFELGASPK